MPFAAVSPRIIRLCPTSALISVGFWALAYSVQGQNLVLNGSFEQGTPAPVAWQSQPGAALGSDAHSGQRCATGKTNHGIVWQTDSIIISTQTDYRLEGWIRCPTGEAHLDLELGQAGVKKVNRLTTPTIRRAQDWRYVALECNSGETTIARAAFSIHGQAELDDVVLTPLATSFLGNKSVEGDERGRVPMWSEEQNGTLLAAKRAGKFSQDSEMKREGKNSVRLVPEGDWFGLASVNYSSPAWTERLELSGWARCEQSAMAQIVACWTDDAQNVVRVDANKPVTSSDWIRVSLLPPPPPSNAMNVRLVAVARGGAVCFDDFELLRLAPLRKAIRVFVNQVGYDSNKPKTAVVAANFLPRSSAELEVKVETESGKIVWNQRVGCAGRVHSGTADDWGWYFWRADFSKIRQVGTFRVTVSFSGERAQSAPFKIGPELLLNETARNAVDFFFIQRCGFAVPGWHKACHLDDANLPDGTHIDATGGWHSAGDYNKLMYENGDGGVVFALLAAQAAAPKIFKQYDRDGDGCCDALDEAQWGSQFVARMQIPETGGLRNHVNQGPGRNWTKWSPPEEHTDNVIGTADDPVIQPGDGNSPLVIGGWARLSQILTERGVTNNYLTRAAQLFSHASQNGRQTNSPHLLLSALEMHRVTRDAVYLNFGRSSIETLLSTQVTSGTKRGAFGDYGELTAGGLASFALTFADDGLTPQIKGALTNYITFCVGTADNPFGVCTRSAEATNGFFPSDLGNNFQLLMRSWAASLAYRVTGDRRALVFAADQLDWVLGKNPVGLCMFEGKGAFNPPRYHHRYNSISGHETGAVPGTIPNGFVRDMGLADRPGFDLSRAGGRSPSHRTSEPWLVHNMWYLMALSAWHGTE